MIRRIPAVCAAVFALTLAPLVAAAQSVAPKTVAMTAEQTSAVVLSLAQVLRDRFAFPDRGAAAAREIEAMEGRGEFRDAATAAALLAMIESKVAPIVNDRHFDVRYLGPDVTADFREGPPSAEDVAAFNEEVRLRGGEVPEVRWLPGNVGYLRINMFLDAPPAFEKLAAAFDMLADTSALIIDVRGSPGGEPSGVANMVGHLVGERTPTVRVEEPFAPASARTYYAEPRTPAFVGKPVYVLIDKRTGSGAEEFAYDLQAMGRATLVGQTTYGAANPGGFRPLAEGFAAFIPTQVVTHTATGANWEGVGVKPDVEVPREEALEHAHRLALETIIADARGARRAIAEEGLAALQSSTH